MDASDMSKWTQLRATYRQFKVVGEEDLEKATAGQWQVICELGAPRPGAGLRAGNHNMGGPLWFVQRPERARFLLGRGEADTLAARGEKHAMLFRAREALRGMPAKPARELLVKVLANVSNILKVSE